jgi:hypothetical protein
LAKCARALAEVGIVCRPESRNGPRHSCRRFRRMVDTRVTSPKRLAILLFEIVVSGCGGAPRSHQCASGTALPIVFGVTAHRWRTRPERSPGRGCCNRADLREPRRAAGRLETHPFRGSIHAPSNAVNTRRPHGRSAPSKRFSVRLDPSRRCERAPYAP